MLVYRLLLIFALMHFGFAFAKKKQDFREVKAISKHKTDAFNHDLNIKRTKFDRDIDEMIFDRLGENYRRANVYDFYPIEVKESMSHQDKVETISLTTSPHPASRDLQTSSGD